MPYGETDKYDTQAAVEAGILIAEPKVLVENHAIAFVLPAGGQVKVEDIEKFNPRPARKRGSYNFADAKSFVAFVNREKTPETVIFANRENPGFTAVFNGNEAANLAEGQGSRLPGDMGQPGWGDHKAVFSCPYSEEWKRWTGHDGVKMTQAEFATFIEDNALDIVQPKVSMTDVPDPAFPDSSTMMVVSRTLEAKNDVTFASAIKLSNGEVQFKYEESLQGSVASGTIEIPQRFAVGIPVFAGTDPWLVFAKLRYRIERGGLSMWYDFERLFKVKERAFDEARAEIATGTSVPIYLGSKV